VHGCRFACLCPFLFLIVVSTGCQPVKFVDTTEPVQPAVEAGAEFDPAACGSVAGDVTWDGEPPPAETIHAWLSSENGVQVSVQSLLVPHVQRNAFQSTQPGTDRGSVVCNAIVFLRGVDARKGRPWSLPHVTVVQNDYQIHIEQGDNTSQVGFVHRGDAIDMVSRQPVFHSLHLSGAAFATIAFPDPDVVRQRVLDKNGIVELSSAAGHYWARGFLFVDDHPYYTRTDGEGHFTLDQVPPGDYDVVCWLLGWRAISHTRDPESALITRQQYEAPIEVVQHLRVAAKMASEVTFAVSAPSPMR
jgi:hypothetical protein